jgi:hypothetical protein
MPRRLPGIPVKLTDSMITLCHLAGAQHALETPEDAQEIRDVLALLPGYVARKDRAQAYKVFMARARAKRKKLPDPYPNEGPGKPAKSAMYRFPPSHASALIKLFRLAEDIPGTALEAITGALGNRANDIERMDPVTLLGRVGA